MSGDILMLAQAASGAGEEELSLLQTLCEAARRRWEARLRPGMVPEDCGAAFTCAAAFTAAADLPGSRGGGAAIAFTAGDVSVKGRTAADAAALAQELRRTAARLMAPYVEAEDFCFRGVRG